MKIFVELTDKRFGKCLINVDHIESIRSLDDKTTISMISETVFVKETLDEIRELIRSLM